MLANIVIDNPSSLLVDIFSHQEWRQRIHLYDNLFTPGTRCEYEWDMCHLPADLSGQSFLDAGSNDGMMSFLAEAKGAAEVVATDIYIDQDCTGHDMNHGWPVSRIEEVKKARGSNVKVERCSIYYLEKLGRTFDTVYCGNVLCWLHAPLYALRQLAAVADQRLIIREDISRLKGKPVMEYLDQPTGPIWIGNSAYYENTLRGLGFRRITIKPIDEYSMMQKQRADFCRYSIVPGTRIYKNPFTDEVRNVQKQAQTCTASSLINKRFFFNLLGWIAMEDVEEVAPLTLSPLRQWIFEMKYRRTALHNCIIIAEK